MSHLVINHGNTPRTVKVVTADGKKTTVQIMSKSRAHPEHGTTVDANYLVMNKKHLKVIPPKTVVPTEIVSEVAVEDSADTTDTGDK